MTVSTDQSTHNLLNHATAFTSQTWNLSFLFHFSVIVFQFGTHGSVNWLPVSFSCAC